MTRFLMLGNPANRRVDGFLAATRAAGHDAVVVAHRDVLSRPDRLLESNEPDLLVRIDSLGEDDEVETMLLGRGHPAALSEGVSTISPSELAARGGLRFGELLCPRQHYLGLVDYLAELERVFAERPSWRILSPPHCIAELFDKRLSQRRLAGLGVPVADPLEGVADPEGLRRAMVELGWGSVFVKLAHGSSASGVALYEFGPERERVRTSMVVRDDGRFNSLDLQILVERESIDAVLDFLIAEGARIERAYAKARIGARHFDVRILLIGGEPMFAVGRASIHPITNLHLGGKRVDLGSVRARIGARTWQRALASARVVAEAYPCLHLGIDVLFESDGHGYRILEANAFGDLLPGLDWAGRDVYAWEIAAALGESLPHDVL